MIDRRLIDLLANRAVVDLGAIAQVIAAGAPHLVDRVRLDDLLALCARLPSGLIHAESIWVLEARPSDLVPLAEGSAWSAMERSLVVEVPASGGDLTALLLDLARYRLAAATIRARLSERSDLIDALDGELDPMLVTELAVLLEAPASEIAGVDWRAPQLRADLAWMARRDFAATVHLHDDVRPDRLEERGRQIADAVLAQLPAGEIWVLISDGFAPIELVSPYVRDLGHALFRWGIENADRLRTFDLAPALEAQQGTPNADLAALVVPDLFRSEPDLLEERRQNEASQGLHIESRGGTTFGWAELARLAAPDRRAIPESAGGALALVCGGAPEVQIAASRRLLASGRVAGIAHVLAAAVRADVVVAHMLATIDDGFHLAGAPMLMEKASELGIAVHPIERLDDPPEVLVRLLRATRYARVRNALPGTASVYSLLTPKLPEGATPTINGRLAGLSAARLALATLLSRASSRDRTGTFKSPSSGQKPSFPRRFRA